MSLTSSTAGPSKVAGGGGGNKPFRFLDLSAELRNKMYELSTDVLEYQPRFKLAKGDEAFRPGAMSPALAHRLLSQPSDRLAPYTKVYVGIGPRLWGHKKLALPTLLLGILGVSKQVSSEALPIFYSVNTFTFYSCTIEYMERWIFEVVGPYKIHLRDVTWQGSGLYDERDVVVAAVLLSLMSLGVLKKDAVLFFHNRAHHILCRLRRFIKCATVNGKIFGQGKDDVADMGLDELVAVLEGPVGDWWRALPEVKGGEPCSVCGLKNKVS